VNNRPCGGHISEAGLFTVKNGKLASAYHVENWVGALEQISK